MECVIAGKTFQYVPNALYDEKRRNQYFSLVKKVFDLNFSLWYASGFCGDSFIPYTLYDGDIAVASVGIAIGNFKWQNSLLKLAQISTVMTEPNYRGMNLSKWLMELVLRELKDKSDLIYLYANDSVLEFYPKFGFDKVSEYAYSMPITRGTATYRKLDLAVPKDVNLLVEKYKLFNNPFSALTMENHLSQMMFHCMTFLRDNIYYVERFDAVVIAEHDDEAIFCYDIFTNSNSSIIDILSSLTNEKTSVVDLGFMPIFTDDCKCVKHTDRS